MGAVGVHSMYLAIDVAQQDFPAFYAFDFIFSFVQIFEVELVDPFQLKFLGHLQSLGRKGSETRIRSVWFYNRPVKRSVNAKWSSKKWFTRSRTEGRNEAAVGGLPEHEMYRHQDRVVNANRPVLRSSEGTSSRQIMQRVLGIAEG